MKRTIAPTALVCPGSAPAASPFNPQGDFIMRKALLVLTAVVALPLAGCAGSEGISTPTAASAVSAASTPSSARAVSSGAAALTLSQGVTDVTLANAGWSCIQPGPVILCAPPGSGLPPIPPAANGQPTYDLMAFTLDHQFDHHVKFLRPDLYHGQPCRGGDPWTYFALLDYYECIIPVRGE
jgi:hypothetical protein